MQKPSHTTNIKYSQQGFKAYGAPGVIPTNDNCPNDIGPNDNSYCAKVRCYTATYDNNILGPLGGGGEPQPSLVCLKLRVEFELWVLSQALLDLKGRPKQGLEYAVKSSVRYSTQLKAKRPRGCSLVPRPDIITPTCIMKVLHVSRREAYIVIRKAIVWGVLRLAMRKNNRPWYGHYEVNWRAVEYVASLLPMNIGFDFDTMTPRRQVRHMYKYTFGAHRLAVEVIKEFNEFWSATRVQAFVPAPYVLSGTPLTPPPFVPNGLLHYTLLELNGRLVPALVLGRGTIYLVPIGIRGGAQSCFPCVSYGNGKYLCAGSVKALLSLVGSLTEPPEPFPYGGHSPRLVVDAGKSGLVPYDSFAPATDRYEPGLSQEDSALLYSCLDRWNVIITSGFMSPFKGWPALVMVAREGVSRAVSHRPDIIRRYVLVCIDALRGFIGSAVRGLRGNALSPQSSVPYAIALARSVTVQAQDPPIEVYVEVLDGFKVREGKNRYRHEGARKLYTLQEFIRVMRASDRPTTAKTVRVIVPLADSPYLKEVYDFGFHYIYHNPQKDQPNAVRAEFRAYKGVTEALGKEGVMKLALGTLHLLEPSLATTYQALATG